MADHVDEQIVQALVALLAGAATGAQVFDSQLYPVQEEDLPALLVDQGEEQIEVLTIVEDPDLDRTMELIVVVKVQQSTEYRKAANALRVTVEKLVAVDRTLGGVCMALTPTGCTWELSGEGELPIASATMRFQARVVTTQSEPDVSI